MNQSVEVKSNGTIAAKQGNMPKQAYDHQLEAMANMDIMDKLDTYSTLLVLPTGSGKTYTASTWLIRHALNRKKKILWIAHRQMLLDQAAHSFQEYAFSQFMPDITSFRYRIISGSLEHDKMIDISPDDDVLIVSKDSLGRSLDKIDAWLSGVDELYLIIDEAHHSTAKTYRRILEYIKKHVTHIKLIGLTATPFRVAKDEAGLLAKTYSDGVKNKKAGTTGMVYQIGLKELMNRQILARPVFESCYSDETIESLGCGDLNKVIQMDQLPKDIQEQLQDSAARNNLIVETYRRKQDVYGQTIVFAVNRTHAIALAGLFQKAGIPAEFVVSDIVDPVTRVRVNAEDNAQKIESYRQGKTKVLVNVNILTEGVDLPQTKTVFLARPTVSTILMTQMIGRALRGVAAGGTSEAYIVSFIDNWNDYIAWVNPESLIFNDDDYKDDPKGRRDYYLRLISIAKIQEFAAMLDDHIDTSDIESLPFEKRIPLGMYAFTCLDENGIEPAYQIMVYDSTKEAYDNMLASMPELMEEADVNNDGFLSEKELRWLAGRCEENFFSEEMIPPYDEKDIWHLLQYYAQYNEAPPFYLFDEIDRGNLNVEKIARKIWNDNMGRQEEKKYLDSLWEESDKNVLRIFFRTKQVFLRQIEIEITKISNPELYMHEKNVTYGRKELADMPLYQMRKLAPEEEAKLRDEVFRKAKDSDGFYVCANCRKRSRSRLPFHVDHIKPMSKGGKSVPDNLQILCRACNLKK